MRTLPPEVQRSQLLQDLARAEAEALRRAAIDDFWRGADALVDTALTQARRARDRLAHRLQRRAARASVTD